jgi:phosphatidylserine decarboxylase
MRLPFTKYGLPEVFIYPLAGLLLMGLLGLSGSFLPGWVVLSGEILFGIAVLWILSFFRDPNREVPVGDDLIVGPADGVVVEVSELSAEESPLGLASVKVGIFLSIFNVHINRSPCGGSVERVCYKRGEFRNALNESSAQVNERNDIYIRRGGDSGVVFIVRQISGSIARRIVCEAVEGDELTRGQKFGMIKFGSRTELYFPSEFVFEVVVKVGDRVRAGSSVIARFR